MLLYLTICCTLIVPYIVFGGADQKLLSFFERRLPPLPRVLALISWIFILAGATVAAAGFAFFGWHSILTGA